MKTFTDPLWGYKLEYPDAWVAQENDQVQAFAASEEALDQQYSGPQAGFMLVRGEFNHTNERIDPLWTAHIAKISMMVGAKDLGSAPLTIEGGTGYEAEIVLPKSRNKRLWTGILSFGLTILHLMVEHPLDQRERFEPLATSMITSLRFASHLPNLDTTSDNIPLPQDFLPVDPKKILTDIDDQVIWTAYSSQAGIGALQAFYTRELPRYGWEITEFYPFPGQSDLPFARLHLTKGEDKLIMGILPNAINEKLSGIVIKINPD